MRSELGMWLGQLVGILSGGGIAGLVVVAFDVTGAWQIVVGAPLIFSCQVAGGLVGNRLDLRHKRDPYEVVARCSGPGTLCGVHGAKHRDDFSMEADDD